VVLFDVSHSLLVLVGQALLFNIESVDFGRLFLLHLRDPSGELRYNFFPFVLVESSF